jgi:hypothetical protein
MLTQIPTCPTQQAALGTCSEPVPARVGTADKRWAATADVTHLQPYIEQQPGPGQSEDDGSTLFTRFRLDSVLSNTYNVPIWASATLQVLYHSRKPSPSRRQVPDAETPAPDKAAATASATQAAGAAVRKQRRGAGSAAGSLGDANRTARRGTFVPAAADVPDEVVPLVPEVHPGVPSSDALTVLTGTGDRCAPE